MTDERVRPRRVSEVTETCGVCGDEVPFSATVHLLVHTRTDEGVIDYFVCRPCYEAEIEPAFG